MAGKGMTIDKDRKELMSMEPEPIIKKKGGSGSGDWHHRGRPGIVGGSGGGGGLAGLGLKLEATIEQRRAASKKAGPNKAGKPKVGKTSVYKPTTKDEFMAIDKDKLQSSLNPQKMRMLDNQLSIMMEYEPVMGQGVLNYMEGLKSYKDPETGMEFDNIIFSYSNGRAVTSASIVNSKRLKAGVITRSFDLKSKIAHNEWMEITSKSARGSGFGARFYQASEDAYMKGGFKEVHLRANLTVGGYAWTRMGYTAKSSSDFDDMKGVAVNSYKKAYGKMPPNASKIENLTQVAALTGPDGRRIGKETLLGTSYNAVKKLDPKDPGYKAGMKYYELKGVVS